jgi:nickel-dependent lactate racemase
MIGAGREGETIDEVVVRELLAAEIATWGIRGRRVLCIVPDRTRSAPIGPMFRLLHELLRDAAALDVMIALGTHPPMTEDAINARMGITASERRDVYGRTRFMNHSWSAPEGLALLGTLPEDEVESISGGRMRERVPVTLNKIALDYDLLVVVGPTFPHEVVGFSGGNKYLFPGISGKEIIDMFHWLGALITNRGIIGRKHTPVRAIVDRAAAMVPVERKCASLVVDGDALVGLFVGSPEEAWSAAADLSDVVNVRRERRAYRSVLSCAPPMYDELWVGGKCAYKLESVVEDGGELIVYAPHISRISATHGEEIRRIGYHVRDYFVAQTGRFEGVSRGVMAHSTHVKGDGSYRDGVERPRIRVTLATGIGEAECRAINLDYVDFRTIDPSRWIDREGDGLLYVPRAGEKLFRLDPATATPRRDARSRALAPNEP